MKTVTIPTAATVSPANRAIFEKLQKGLGMVSNLYATLAHSEHALVDVFFAAGYSQVQLVATVMVIVDKIITNYLHALTQVPIDFPAAPAL